ncbi:M20 family metallopeptidase [Acidiferrimicrobium sp. IK]|uniref:M20 family metallopeptidase n=1 Tax=Acidiferrimicrobium sp. IK TaxID=2871700 RepID=UPI0021CB64D5|nr:M20 family metallopeptidase [Acidiferrimicrobium sp. IK]MCU4184954.1 M20 family metallopeptidase [Acidiferrimicrobium sp. IK]
MTVEMPQLVVDDDVVDFTQQLVRIRSVYDPVAGTDESAAAELVVSKMREFGWAPTVTEVAPGRPNVVADVDGGGGPGPILAFEGHLDVVTEGNMATWTVDPYGGEIRDGRLYGRGSADMKSGVAAMLYAVRALQLAGPFAGRIRVMALIDEEGMMLGAKHLAASGGLEGVDGVIVCEPEEGEICTSAKGALRVRVDMHGKMAHGAMPQHGRNPLPAVARLAAWCGDYQDKLQAETGTHPHLGDVYVTPTVLSGGSLEQMNVIPAVATVALDVRTVPGVDHAKIVEAVTDAANDLAAAAGVTAEVAVIDDRPSVEVDPDHPMVRALAEAHRAVTGEEPRYGGVPGSTDGTVLTRDAGVATVVYGPGGKWIAHQSDEYVEVDEIRRATAVFAEAARRFLSRVVE